MSNNNDSPHCPSCGRDPLDIERAAASAPVPAHAPEVMQYFSWGHLPAHLQDISRPFGELARSLCEILPNNLERQKALDRLLEAKDAAVRSHLARP